MHESEKWKWSRSVVSNSSQPVDCSLPGSSVHGIFQARVLEWGAIAFSENMAQMNLFTEQKQTPRHREQACGCQGEREGWSGTLWPSFLGCASCSRLCHRYLAHAVSTRRLCPRPRPWAQSLSWALALSGGCRKRAPWIILSLDRGVTERGGLD